MKKIIQALKRITLWQWFVLIFIAGGTIFAIKFFGREVYWRTVRVQVVGQDWTHAYQSEEGYRAPYWLVSQIDVGDQERGITGGVVAEVIDVDVYERDQGQAEAILTLRLYGDLDAKRQRFVANSWTISVGEPIELNLDGVMVAGQIIDDNVTESDLETQKKLATVRYQNIEQSVARQVGVGDVITNGGGRVVAEVKSLWLEPATNNSLARASNSNLYLSSNQRLVDLMLVIELDLDPRDEQLVFAGYQVIKVGNDLELHFPSVNLYEGKIQNLADTE